MSKVLAANNNTVSLSGTDAYLLEHSGLIRAANKVISGKVSRFGKVTRTDVAVALLRIPKVRNLLQEKNTFSIERLKNILSTAARRGAFPGYILSRHFGFRRIKNDQDVQKEAALRGNVITAATALFDHLGLEVTFAPKKSNVLPFKKLSSSQRMAA